MIKKCGADESATTADAFLLLQVREAANTTWDHWTGSKEEPQIYLSPSDDQYVFIGSQICRKLRCTLLPLQIGARAFAGARGSVMRGGPAVARTELEVSTTRTLGLFISEKKVSRRLIASFHASASKFLNS
jgi:hypothetical protein